MVGVFWARILFFEEQLRVAVIKCFGFLVFAAVLCASPQAFLSLKSTAWKTYDVRVCLYRVALKNREGERASQRESGKRRKERERVCV